MSLVYHRTFMDSIVPKMVQLYQHYLPCCKQTNVIFFNQIQQMSKTAVWTASISLNNFNTKFFNFTQPGHGIMTNRKLLKS